jgi:hypothetical protein
MHGAQGLTPFTKKEWFLKNEELEEFFRDGTIAANQSAVAYNGNRTYLNFSIMELPSNCGALYISGQDYQMEGILAAQKRAIAARIDFLARNYASLTGHNVLMISGQLTNINHFVKLGTGWTLGLGTKSHRHGYRKNMGYAICEIPKADMKMKGYGY